MSEQAKKGGVLVLDHPLVQHKLTLLRRVATTTGEFRRLMHELSLLLCYEATRDLPLRDAEIETPLGPMTGQLLAGYKVCLLSIMRAGEGLLSGFIELLPSARVAHIGLARDEETHKPDLYYYKVPSKLDRRVCIVVDPMLATGGSAIAAIETFKKSGAKAIRFVCLVASPEGIEALRKAHPDVDVVVGAVDEKLNEDAYIVPGLGDAGDRYFGTK
ncbi:MAG: uracil phosphoribosyltransferase [Sphingomonadales bacterium]|nr:uracil phosphoribosyltransferase [Sphingomonadales bacterium]